MTSLVLGVPTVPVTYSSNYCTDYLHMLMFFDSVKCFGDKTFVIHINNVFYWDMQTEEERKYKGPDIWSTSTSTARCRKWWHCMAHSWQCCWVSDAISWSYESQSSTAGNCTLQQQTMLTNHCWFWLYTIK